MEIPFFLAMTDQEQANTAFLPRYLAHMSCRFSPNGVGLTGIPETLPAGSVLILDDATPMGDHRISLIESQLMDAVTRLSCRAVLLDFQRSVEPQCAELANRLSRSLPCPMAISEGYAAGLDCPVFLSPPPPNQLLEEITAPWQGRELWLDSACTNLRLTLTEAGCELSLPTDLPGGVLHQDDRLCCHYSIAMEADKIRFTLCRTKEDLVSLIHALSPFGLTCAIGLYQELGENLFP